MAEGEWSNRRYQTAYEEGRAVVNAQNETLADIDDKAMRTTRLNAILIGLLIAAVEYAPNQFHHISLSLAFGALVLSTIFGAVTYNESNLFVGPRGKYIERLANGETDVEPWDEDLAKLFSGLISENHSEIRRNSRLLDVTLGLLIGGIVAAVIAVGI